MAKGNTANKTVKELIQKNSIESYEALRAFYLEVIRGDVYDTRITKEGEVIQVQPSISVKVEAAAALQRMDIDKVQGNAKSRESEDSQAVSSDVLSRLSSLAEKKAKK